MTIPRKNIVDKSTSGFSHCTTCCVHRAFLCSDDAYSGKNDEHRRKWMRERLLVLSGIFAADVDACALMSNRDPVVLFMDGMGACLYASKRNRYSSPHSEVIVFCSEAQKVQ